MKFNHKKSRNALIEEVKGIEGVSNGRYISDGNFLFHINILNCDDVLGHHPEGRFSYGNFFKTDPVINSFFSKLNLKTDLFGIFDTNISIRMADSTAVRLYCNENDYFYINDKILNYLNNKNQFIEFYLSKNEDKEKSLIVLKIDNEIVGIISYLAVPESIDIGPCILARRQAIKINS